MRAPPTGRQRLRSFRLEDIPIDLRLRAVRAAASTRRIAEEDVSPAALLLARIRSDFWDADEVDTSAYDGMRQIAERPSDRVYWIPAAAWDRVIGARP